MAQIDPKDPFKQVRQSPYGRNLYGEPVGQDPFRSLPTADEGQLRLDVPEMWIGQALGAVPEARQSPTGRHYQRMMRHPLMQLRVGDTTAAEALMNLMNPGMEVTESGNWMANLLSGGYGTQGNADSPWMTAQEGREALASLFYDRPEHMEELLYQAGAEPEDINNMILALLSMGMSRSQVGQMQQALDRKAWDFMQGIGETGLDPDYMDYLYGTGLLQLWGGLPGR